MRMKKELKALYDEYTAIQERYNIAIRVDMMDKIAFKEYKEPMMRMVVMHLRKFVEKYCIDGAIPKTDTAVCFLFSPTKFFRNKYLVVLDIVNERCLDIFCYRSKNVFCVDDPTHIEYLVGYEALKLHYISKVQREKRGLKAAFDESPFVKFHDEVWWKKDAAGQQPHG